MSEYASVDCEKGRALGCKTFCCKLVVRLDPEERGPDGHGTVEKSPDDGYCVHLDRQNHLCKIWDQRSRVCRGYTCHGDMLFQVAVRNKFNTLVDLVRLAATAYIPKDSFIEISDICHGGNQG